MELLAFLGLMISLVGALVGLATALVGWRRSSKVDHASPVLEQMQRDKAEMLGHVTANRVQAQRHTDKVARERTLAHPWIQPGWWASGRFGCTMRST